MSNLSSVLVVLYSFLAKEATGILREHYIESLYNYSMRVYLSAAEQDHQQKLRFDLNFSTWPPIDKNT
jgi:hypothetical protein